MYSQPDSINSQVIFKQHQHPALKVYRDQVTMPDGTQLGYNRIEQNHGQPGVLILPVRVRDEAIGLIKQYRYPVGSYSWELPRGFVPAGQETTDQAAIRELREETGLACSASCLTSLGICYPDSGILMTQIDMYAALIDSSEERTAHPEDTHEISTFAWFSRQNIMASIMDHAIADGLTLSALMKLESNYDAIMFGEQAIGHAASSSQ